MALLATLFFGFAPMFLFAYILYWLDRYEKEPILLLGGVFLWGMCVAAGGAYLINTTFSIGIYILTGSESISNTAMDVLGAPLVEEGLKGLAVLLVFLVFYREYDSVLDGIVYAGITALGFAATENSIYIWRGFEAEGWTGLLRLTIVRVIIVGWQHPVFTSFTGIGLAIARLNRSIWVKIGAPIAGWTLAFLAHAIHNALAVSTTDLACWLGRLLDWSGVLFIFCMVLWATWREQRNLVNHLREEVELGTLSAAQYRTACSAWAQSFARLIAVFSGQFIPTSRFYQACGELAHKKEQLRRLGQEGGNGALVEKYRTELARWAPRAQSL